MPQTRSLPRSAWFVVRFLTGPSPSTDQYPQTVLTQDKWDDYGYKTTFNATLHLAAGDIVELGTVRVLKKGQSSGFTPMPKTPFDALDESYCSLGGEFKYYKKLFDCGPSVYEPYLSGLRDVTHSDDIRGAFEDLEGYRASLLRAAGAESTIAEAAKLFATTKPAPRVENAGLTVKFKTRVANDANSFTIEFDFRSNASLPNRINVLVGYNGTGKTRLLSNLAIVASGYGYARKEDAIARTAGRFIDPQPPFKTVVVLSYSAFDTFAIPGRTDEERARLQERGEIFGYVYCGLREHDTKNIDVGTETYRLKSPQDVEAEFLSAFRRVRELGRLEALRDVLKPLLDDSSFQRSGLTQLYTDPDADIGYFFSRLSSGHKVVLKISADLTAHIDAKEPTLVLLDEPETHLHPPLLAALLKSVKVCLDRFDGYAVIATHSPVVLQETPSRFVRVLRRAGQTSRIEFPSLETFGESIGVITQDVFNLDDAATDWHQTLLSLATDHSLEQIEDMLGRKLGFAARSYVVALHGERDE